jgi:hypothetical protein
MTRAELRRRVEAAEAQAQKMRERAAVPDFSTLSFDELLEIEALFYIHHGGLTEDEAYLVARDDAYYRHEAHDCLDPKFPAAARRAIAALIERRIRILQSEGKVPPEKAERLRDVAYMRRVSELGRRYLPAWNRRGSPCWRELAQAMRDLDGEGTQEDGSGSNPAGATGVIPLRPHQP